jgi:hypothetical protein
MSSGSFLLETARIRYRDALNELRRIHWSVTFTPEGNAAYIAQLRIVRMQYATLVSLEKHTKVEGQSTEHGNAAISAGGHVA